MQSSKWNVRQEETSEMHAHNKYEMTAQQSTSCRKRRRRAGKRVPSIERDRLMAARIINHPPGKLKIHYQSVNPSRKLTVCYNFKSTCAIFLLTALASQLFFILESDNLKLNLIQQVKAQQQNATVSPLQTQTPLLVSTTTTAPTSSPFANLNETLQQVTSQQESSSSSGLAVSTSAALSTATSATTTTTTTQSAPTQTKRDLTTSDRFHQQQSQRDATATANKRSGNVCQVNDGESVAILEIEESRGSDTSQRTSPGELPISGSVSAGEIELKIESETHKYFQVKEKSLRLTRPLDRDATLKENSTQIGTQPITSIYLQISCIDKRPTSNNRAQTKKVIIPVLVKVLDLNDNAPKFSQPIYSIQVNELAPVGTIIMDQFAFAIDLDSASNGQVDYSLLGPTTTPLLELQATAAAALAPAPQAHASKSIVPQKLASTPTNQRLVLPSDNTSASAQNISPSSSNSLSPSSTSSSSFVARDFVSSTLADGVTSASTSQTTRALPSSNESPTIRTPSGSVEKNDRDEEDDDVDWPSSSPAPAPAPAPAPSSSSAGVQRSSASNRLREPTINLNSEPILNGPMEETDEDESDETLLAAMNAATATGEVGGGGGKSNNSTDSDSDTEIDTDLPDSDQPSEFSASRARLHSDTERTRGVGLSPHAAKSSLFARSSFRHQHQQQQRRRRRRKRRDTLTSVAAQPTTTTLTTAANARGPAPSRAVDATGNVQPPWTNLMMISNEDLRLIDATNANGATRSLAFGADRDQQQLGAWKLAPSSNEFFSLELAPHTNKPVIKLKQKLDYETQRIHQLTLVATDRAQNKRDRMSSWARIIIRVLDGDDQPPAFILDQVGCATNSVPQTTSPLPFISSQTSSSSSSSSQPSPLVSPSPSSAGAIVVVESSGNQRDYSSSSSSSSTVADLLQQEAQVDRQQKRVARIAEGAPRVASSRPSETQLPAQKSIDLLGHKAASNNTNSVQLRTFRVTDENFDFGDTLGLDDVPLDERVGALKSIAIAENGPSRTRRVPLATRGDSGAILNGNFLSASQTTPALSDYLCLSPSASDVSDGTGKVAQTNGDESATQLAEYFATVVSGDSDYLLRIAPQSIKARDRDELNAPIRFSFINGTPANFSAYFQINSLDATIKQLAPVERAHISEFTLFVRAQEQSYNRLFSVAKLTIDVLPSDKNPPVLVPNAYSGHVDENSPIGTRVLIPSAGSSNKPAAYLRILVLDPDDHSSSLSAAAATAAATTTTTTRAAELDKSTIAYKNNGDIEDEREQAKLTTRFARDDAPKVSNKQAKFEFETTSDAFKVDRDGFVYVNKFPLDRDLPQGQMAPGTATATATATGAAVHMFQVTARQVGLISSRSISSPISLNITLDDLNDNPPQLINSSFASPIQMAANSQGGARQLVRLEAIDRDLEENSQMHFSIEHVSNGGGARFRVDEDSGRIEALGKFSAGEQFSLSVRVADELGRSSQGIVEVRVVPGANTGGPQFLSAETGDIEGRDLIPATNPAASQQPAAMPRAGFHQSVEVNEGAPVGSVILQVRASDPENDPITYSIIDGNINQDFTINSKTGSLVVAKRLDREEISAYRLIVQARDSGGLATSRPIHIQVTDANDQNPVFSQAHYVFAVEEGVPGSSSGSAPHVLGRVLAQDSDEGENGRVTYSLLPLDNSDNGAAATAAAAGSNSYASDATTQARAHETAANSSSGGGGGSKQQKSDGLFTIDEETGEIRLMCALDYEQRKSHTLMVVARDRGENPRSSSAMVQVRVLDRQDEIPYFERSHVETRLDENLAPGSRVAAVHANDPDSVAQITYVLLGGDASLFHVEPQTGLVTIAPAITGTGPGLDYETAQFHSLIIGTNESLPEISNNLNEIIEKLSESIATKQSARANNEQRETFEKWPIVRVDIFLNDLNDNAPQFGTSQPMPVRVQDSVALGTLLPVNLQARDADGSAPNNQIKYELVTSDHELAQAPLLTSEKCAQLFLVDPTTCQISVRADLKRDSLSECQLVIRARDLPLERAAPGRTVAVAVAAAAAAAERSLSSLIVLTVYIDHLAELSPASMIAFADTSYTLELAENTQANKIIKVLPVINKPKVAFPMSCEILSGNELNRFFISENNQRDCELKTRDNLLDYEQKQRFNLIVRLNTLGNGGHQQQHAHHSSLRAAQTAHIQINILDANDHRPAFVNLPARYSQLTQNRYLAAIAYDSPPETQLIQLRATDADSSQANGLISYELLNEPDGFEGRFRVDSQDGILRTSRPIEDTPPTRLPIKLKVMARDNPELASESLSSVAEVVVNLIDDRHRMALVLKDTPASRVLDNKDELLSVLQERTGLISGLERVESLKLQRNSTLVEPDVSGTDVWFYLIEPGTLRIISNDDARLKAALFESRAQNSLADIIRQNLGFEKARVRLSYSMTNALNSNSLTGAGHSTFFFGAIRADSSDRLASTLILIAIFIAIASAIVVIYQCGSVAGLSESEANRRAQQQQQLGYATQGLPNFGEEKFLFSQLPPPPAPTGQYQFPNSDESQTPALLGTFDQRFSDQFLMTKSSSLRDAKENSKLNCLSNGDQRPNYGLSASEAKEYETQMLKMSVLFDDGQSFDDHNLDFSVNKNLV